MATEEIEISELEFTEELASDNLIPIESLTDTKATSLQILKNWLSSFFATLIGNNTFEGFNTFKADNRTDVVRLTTKNVDYDVTKSNASTGVQVGFVDAKGKASAIIENWHADNGNKYLLIGAWNEASGERTRGSISVGVDASGIQYATAPTPPTSSNGLNIATTAWFHNNKKTISGWCIPDYNAGVSLANNATTNISTSGVVVIYATGGNGAGDARLRVGSKNGKILAQTHLTSSYNSTSYTQTLVGSGTYYFENGNTGHFNAVFYPMKGAK